MPDAQDTMNSLHEGERVIPELKYNSIHAPHTYMLHWRILHFLQYELTCILQTSKAQSMCVSDLTVHHSSRGHRNELEKLFSAWNAHSSNILHTFQLSMFWIKSIFFSATHLFVTLLTPQLN